ncbi:hypothetical protein IJ090_03220 [Candidatus Saccharibacteria bacterium]|nr:hypothetical protein [Candidatus Saccharibacteria bacterium]
MIKLKQKLRVIKYLPVALVAVFLGFLAYNCLFPPASTEAATATASLSAEVEPVIELALDTSSLALSYNGETEITPTSGGVTATGTVNVYVSTNNTTGYTLRAYTSDSTTSMTHSNANVSTSIAATGGNTSTLEANKWGFRRGNETTWYPIGASSTGTAGLITENGSETGLCTSDLSTNYASCYSAGTAEKTTITFGANLTDSLPAGSYTNHVVFSAIANPGEAEN